MCSKRNDRWEADGGFGNKSNFQSPGNRSPATGSLQKGVPASQLAPQGAGRGVSRSCFTKLADALLYHVEGASPRERPRQAGVSCRETTRVALGQFCPVRPGIRGFVGGSSGRVEVSIYPCQGLLSHDSPTQLPVYYMALWASFVYSHLRKG